MKKIGIFGSSFNPIHIGHLMMMEQARVRFNLDKILLIPTKNAYHKKETSLSFEKRYMMAKIEADKNEFFEASDIELQLTGNSYTYELLKLLKKERPQDRFYFIMGADSLINFHTWYRYESLIHDMTYLVFSRPGEASIDDLIKSYRLKGMQVHLISDLQLQISSSQIRDSVSDKRSIRYLVTDDILNHIFEKGYYG